MAGKKLDLGEFAKSLNVGVSNLNTGREQIEYIDIDLLDDDPRNFYALDDLDDLAANIQVCGLQQPIRVRAGEAGRYTIVSGHRRRAALRKLVEDGLEQYRQVPCIPEREDVSPAMQELRLIFANSATRKLTSAELSHQAERVEALLYELKGEGYEFDGRMRDQVAAACQTTSSKLARLSVIRKRLGPEFLPLFEKDQLPEQSAYTLAKFPREFQTRLRGAFAEIPTGSTLERLLSLYKNEGYRWEPDMSCAVGKPCKRGDAFLRHDADCLIFETCGGKTCCLECKRAFEDYYACDKACSKAKAKRKEARDEAKAMEMEREAAKKGALLKEIRASAQRILKAIDSADVLDALRVVWTRYGGGYTAKDIRDFANGDFSRHNFYSNEISPENLADVGKTARLLNCTTDYLLGVTDELTPAAPAQMPDPPADEEAPDVPEAEKDQEPRPVIVRWENRGKTPPIGALILTYDLTNVGPVLRPAIWNGSQFHAPGNPDKIMTGLQFTQWLQVPPVHSGQQYQLEEPPAASTPPADGWVPLQFVNGMERPPRDGLYYCRFDGDGTVLKRTAWWDDSVKKWRFKENGIIVDAKCIGWFPLPPMEEAT